MEKNYRACLDGEEGIEGRLVLEVVRTVANSTMESY